MEERPPAIILLKSIISTICCDSIMFFFDMYKCYVSKMQQFNSTQTNLRAHTHTHVLN